MHEAVDLCMNIATAAPTAVLVSAATTVPVAFIIAPTTTALPAVAAAALAAAALASLATATAAARRWPAAAVLLGAPGVLAVRIVVLLLHGAPACTATAAATTAAGAPSLASVIVSVHGPIPTAIAAVSAIAAIAAFAATAAAAPSRRGRWRVTVVVIVRVLLRRVVGTFPAASLGRLTCLLVSAAPLLSAATAAAG